MIEMTVEIPASVNTAWDCLTETVHLRRWWNAGISLNAVPGGHFEEPWIDAEGTPVITSGTVLGLKALSELRLSWANADWPIETEVTIELKRTAQGTRLILTHGGWSAFPEGDRAHLIATHRAGWARHLRNLATYAGNTLN